jgi:hypothetical protein
MGRPGISGMKGPYSETSVVTYYLVSSVWLAVLDCQTIKKILIVRFLYFKKLHFMQ